MLKFWNHEFRLIRHQDFLNLKFYFFNLKPSLNGELLERIQSPEPVYMIVELPQQHVSEELITKNSETLKNGNETRKSFTSSFSFLTFEIPDEILNDSDKLKNDVSFFLSWNSYRLITLREKFIDNTYTKNVSIVTENEYPLTLQKLLALFNQNKHRNFAFTSGLKNTPLLPISFYESPRKIFMAFSPYNIAEVNNYSIQFSNTKGSLIQYFPKNLAQKNLKLIEVWNRNIWYKSSENTKNPESKIIGFSRTFGPDKDTELQPTPLQRENLAKLTNIPPKKNETLSDRNIKYTSYNTGAFGESSQYNYFNAIPFDDSNPSDTKHYQIVGTHHITELGKDNLDIITTRAVDINTGLKLYVSIVSQRIHNYKTSYLQKRYLLEYVSREINYEDYNYHKKLPYKKIIALDDKKFFNPKHFKPFDAYAVLEENLDANNNTSYPKDLIKLKYKGIDHNNKEHFFEMDILFIPESTVKITQGIYKYEYEDFNNTSSQRPPIYYHVNDSVGLQHQGLLDKEQQDYEFEIIPFEKEDWACKALKLLNRLKAINLNEHLLYIEKEITIATQPQENSSPPLQEKNISDGNGSLVTNGIFTVSVFDNNNTPEFSKEIPVIPQLGYLNTFIPQLKGIEKEPKTHQVTFSKVNKESVFLKTLELPQKKLIEITKNSFETIETTILEQARKIDNLSSNLLNSDSLINLDLQIDSLSFGKNALISSKAIQDNINDLKIFDPSKIFGKAEILGFDLSKLFVQLLEKELPITKTIQSKIENVQTDITNLLINFETQFGNTGQQILDAWNSQISLIKKQLNDTKTALKNEKNKLSNYLEINIVNEAEKYKRLIEKEIRNFSKARISEVLEYKEFYENEVYNTIYHLYLDNNIPELKINLENQVNAFLKDNVYNRDIIKLLRYIYKKEATSFNIKQAKYRFLSSFIKVLFGLIDSIKIEQQANLVLEIVIFKVFSEINSITKSVHPIQGRANQIFVLPDIQDVLNEIEKNEPLLNKIITKEEHRSRFKKILPLIQKTLFKILDNSREQIKNVSLTTQKEILLIEEQLRLLPTRFPEIPEIPQEIAAVKKYINYFKINCLNEEFRKIYNEYATARNVLEKFLRGFNVAENEIRKSLKTIDDELANFQAEFIRKLKLIVTDFIDEISNSKDAKKIRNIYNNLKKDSEIFRNPRAFKTHFEKFVELESKRFYDAEKRRIENEIDKLESKISGYEFEIKNSVHQLKEEIKKKIKDLTVNEREQLKRIQKVLLSNRSQKIEYSFSNKNLKSIDAGFAKLVTNKQSSFTIDSKVEILFKNKLPPAIEKKETFVKTKLTKIGVNIIDSIQVNFNRIYYQNGTNLPQDFQVEVRDIQFDGVFNFIAAFEKYLKDFGGDNLLLDFDATGVTIGYKYPLPKIAFGYFNLFNLKLNVLFRLSFITGDPMKVILGINNPKDRFIVTVNGFPGTGYFFVELNPKKGITKIAFLIEFGAHLSFNLGVASGSASFKAGIYYLKKHDKVDIGGYVLCSGHFRVLGLFSASLVFNLRFKLIGYELIARGCVKTSYRFSRWFKVSATVAMKHKTSFDHSGSKSARYNENLTTNSLHTLSAKSDQKNKFTNTENKKELIYEYSNIDQLDGLEKGDTIFLIIKQNPSHDTTIHHDYQLEYEEYGAYYFTKKDEFLDVHTNNLYVRWSVTIEHYGLQKIIHTENDILKGEFEFNLIEDSILVDNEYQKAFLNSYFKTI